MSTIDEVLSEFLKDQRARLSDRSYLRYEEVIDLFALSMNGHGANRLDDDDFRRWEKRFELDEETAFTGLFGPDKIAENVGEFLDYFMIRKVMASKELLKSAGTVTKKLAEWLGANGHVDPSTAAEMAAHGGTAAADLPAMDQLAGLLYDETRRLPDFDAAGIPDDHWVDDYLTITKVEPGRLWFDGLDAPLVVSEATSQAARRGWSVNLEAVKLDTGWHPLEVGNVYP